MTDQVPDEKVESSTAPEAEVETEVIVQTEVEKEAGATEEKPKHDGFQKRINQFTRDKYELKQANEQLANSNQELKKRLDAIEASKPFEATAEAPKEEDFETDSQFQAALIQHTSDVATEKAVAKIRAENDSNNQEAVEREIQTSLLGKKKVFEESVQEKRGNFEDFDEVAYGHQFMDQDMAGQIFELDNGPEVAYHIGSNLDEAERIFALDPVSRARELTKLDFKVEALAPKLVSDAPDPIKALGNSETVGDTDPMTLDPDAWQQYEYDRLRKKAESQ